jgi:hypothetical protein
MRFRIRYRIDTSEFFETDDYEFVAEDWTEVYRHIESIERNNTVLSVERLDI